MLTHSGGPMYFFLSITNQSKHRARLWSVPECFGSLSILNGHCISFRTVAPFFSSKQSSNLIHTSIDMSSRMIDIIHPWKCKWISNFFFFLFIWNLIPLTSIFNKKDWQSMLFSFSSKRKNLQFFLLWCDQISSSIFPFVIFICQLSTITRDKVKNKVELKINIGQKLIPFPIFSANQLINNRWLGIHFQACIKTSII